MIDFWKEMERGVECIRLVRQLLKEEENLARHLKSIGRQSCHSDFNIARMKYALGEISVRPNYKDYFSIRDSDMAYKSDF